MGIIEGNHAIQMAGLGIIFQYEESKSMIAEALGEYALASM